MNTPVANHRMIGATLTYRPELENMTHLPLSDGYIVRNGDEVVVREVFHDWNGVEGLTMFYVFVPATGHHTHLSERETGLEK